jgi:predicted enzyme related to lactoylglutathione lyase
VAAGKASNVLEERTVLIVERVTGIGGVFFRSRDPKALLEWYRIHLGIEPAEDFHGHVFRWEVDPQGAVGSTTWAIFPADTAYFGDPGSSFMINFRVQDLDRVLEQLGTAGVAVTDRVEESEYGRFGWAMDPEGNRFELWQPAAGL